MTLAALFFFAAAAAPAGGDSTPPSRGVEIARAQVSVTMLRPAVVRQSSGWEPERADAPRPQITRRGREVLVEFQ